MDNGVRCYCVPEADHVTWDCRGLGIIRCWVCGLPTRDHSLTKPCSRTPVDERMVRQLMAAAAGKKPKRSPGRPRMTADAGGDLQNGIPAAVGHEVTD